MDKEKGSHSAGDEERTNKAKGTRTSVKFSKNTQFNDSQSKLDDNDSKYSQQ